jgi:hypothetical protein
MEGRNDVRCPAIYSQLAIQTVLLKQDGDAHSSSAAQHPFVPRKSTRKVPPAQRNTRHTRTGARSNPLHQATTVRLFRIVLVLPDPVETEKVSTCSIRFDDLSGKSCCPDPQEGPEWTRDTEQPPSYMLPSVVAIAVRTRPIPHRQHHHQHHQCACIPHPHTPLRHRHTIPPHKRDDHSAPRVNARPAPRARLTTSERNPDPKTAVPQAGHEQEM